MARFTVRVELHNASREHYEQLHKKMTAHGFSDVISVDGRRYRLPPAEYNFVGSATRDQVLEKAKAAARSVVEKFAVFVTESNGRTWHGLEVIQERSASAY